MTWRIGLLAFAWSRLKVVGGVGVVVVVVVVGSWLSFIVIGADLGSRVMNGMGEVFERIVGPS